MEQEGREANNKQKHLAVACCDTPRGGKHSTRDIRKENKAKKTHGKLSYHLLKRFTLCVEASGRQSAQCQVPCTLVGLPYQGQ